MESNFGVEALVKFIYCKAQGMRKQLPTFQELYRIAKHHPEVEDESITTSQSHSQVLLSTPPSNPPPQD